jgi:hypothetical protein
MPWRNCATRSAKRNEKIMKIYLSHGKLPAGGDWQKTLKQALDSFDAGVFVVDAASEQSPWLQREWSAAVEQSWSNPQKPMIPVLVGDVEAPPFLHNRQAIRVTEEDRWEEMDMAVWRAGHRSVYELDEWQKADEFSTLLHNVCGELDLGRDKEWLIHLLKQTGRLMCEAVAAGWSREYLAEFILGISEALTFLALVDYYLVFLRHEGYLTGQRADEVDRRLSALQDTLSSLAGRLREALRARPEGPLAFSPWSRN